ncbi:hypothetical protein GCM10009612_35770 [Streptomyces beijiangensis]
MPDELLPALGGDESSLAVQHHQKHIEYVVAVIRDDRPRPEAYDIGVKTASRLRQPPQRPLPLIAGGEEPVQGRYGAGGS